MYAQTKNVTLPIGLRNPSAPNDPPARKLQVRMPTVSDELWAEAQRKELLGSAMAQDVEFASAPTSTDVLFLARVITQWEGRPLHTWRDVAQLARVDFYKLRGSVAELEDEAVKDAEAADKAGETRPLSPAVPAS